MVAGANYGNASVQCSLGQCPMHQLRSLVAVAAVVLPSRGVMYVVASRWVIGVLRSILCLVGQLCV